MGSLAQGMFSGRKSVIQHDRATSHRSRRQWMNVALRKHRGQKAQVDIVIRHLVDDPQRGMSLGQVFEPAQVMLGQPVDRARREARDVVDRRAGNIENRRNGVERLPRKPQLARAKHARMAGEDLFDKGCARARQAEHEHRAKVRRACPG